MHAIFVNLLCTIFVVFTNAMNIQYKSEIFIKSDKYDIHATSLSGKMIKTNLECPVLCMRFINCTMIVIKPATDANILECLSYQTNMFGNTSRISAENSSDVWYKMDTWLQLNSLIYISENDKTANNVISANLTEPPTSPTTCPLPYVFIESACLYADNTHYTWENAQDTCQDLAPEGFWGFLAEFDGIQVSILNSF